MKVFLGLSGGVDSSVSAVLLQEAGHDVTGAFITVWQPDWLECSLTQDRQDALRVAAALAIPFIDIDGVEAYKQQVVDYMVRDYQAGRTPNPDIMCNKHVKFGVFFDEAMKAGADMIATGHYCRREPISQNPTLGYRLLKGKDTNKDQSYFLWSITQDQLAKTLFPVGDLEKPAVRALAHQHHLITADKKDSQGLCFIGKLDLKEFLTHFIGPQPTGNVVNEDGEVIGHHDGALFFTIGQRHGFTITKKTPNDTPYYVIQKDVSNNTITVSQTPQQQKDITELTLEQTNWIRQLPERDKIYTARWRYRGELHQVSITQLDDTGHSATVRFTAPQALVPSGQSLVLYDDEECIGGGIISMSPLRSDN